MDLGMNFDEAREERRSRPNTFQIGGEVFTFRVGLRPEAFSDLIQEYADSLENPQLKGLERTAIVDRTIVSFLEGEDEGDRWYAVRAIEEDAITAGDMQKVLLWLIEQQTDLPTTAPSSSGNGGATTGARSTARSSSRRAASVVSEG